MNLLRLALRLLRRDWRSGYLNLLLLALLVAVTTHNTIGFLSERIENAMAAQATHLMGGDLVVRSPTPSLENYRNTENNALESARVVEFSSVVMAGDEMQLTSVKAVSSLYPLKSHLRIADSPFTEDRITTAGPAQGKAWLETRLLSLLNLQVGDTVEVGDAELEVEQVLTFEPDRGGNFYSFVPRLMMNEADLEQANLIQTGSRVDYYYQFAGPSNAIGNLQETIAGQLQPGQQILSIESRQQTVSAALTRAQGYLQLASLMAILLASVALAMGAQFFSQIRYDSSALLRCFGLQSKQILFVFITQLITLSILGGLIGGLLGWSLHFIILEILAELLPKNIPLPSLMPFVSGLGLALLILLGFSLPALIQLQRVSPLRVLRKDLNPAPLSNSLMYALVVAIVLALMLWYVQDVFLIAAITLGAILAWVATLLLSKAFAWLLGWISQFSSLSIQAGLRNLSRRQQSTRIQLLGFGLTAMAMLVVILVRGELLSTWQAQLPENVPNHFVMNVLPEEVASFNEFLNANQIESQPLYPIVRGRLTHINQVPVKEAVTKENPGQDVPRAINRELSLTWAPGLPSDNQIVEGQWWQPNSSEGRQVSIEQELADRLDIKLGDTLGFFVAGQTFEADVASVRTVKWESFQPNFYLMFEPGDLDGLPATYLTSFHLSGSNKPQLKQMVQQFPSITLLEVDVILRQVRTILAQVSAAVEFILLFVLAAGLTITLATLVTTMPQRYKEGALMRTLGATRKQLILQQWSEFFAIGFLSGLVACAGAEMVRLGIYWKIFQLPYAPYPWIWIIVPPTLGLLIGLAGNISSKRILRQSPVVVLRD